MRRQHSSHTSPSGTSVLIATKPALKYGYPYSAETVVGKRMVGGSRPIDPYAAFQSSSLRVKVWLSAGLALSAMPKRSSSKNGRMHTISLSRKTNLSATTGTRIHEILLPIG